MLPTLTIALRQIHNELATVLTPATIREACRAAGHQWRERVLDPVTTIHLFLLPLLHRNTACAHRPRLTGRTFTASADRRARARIPLAGCQALLRRVTDAARPLTDPAGRWRGHRTWFVDGTGVSMPDTPDLAGAFGYAVNQRAGCGFPVAELVVLLHAGTGLLRHLSPGPLRSHEMARVTRLHPEMRAGDGLVGDRGLRIVRAPGASRAARAARRVPPDRPAGDRLHPGPGGSARWDRKALWGKARSRWVRSLGPTDQVVEWYKPYTRPKWITVEEYATLPKFIPVRECRYEVDRPGVRVWTVTLVSTRLDAGACPPDALAELHRARWRVELDVRHWKITLGMDVLGSTTADGGGRRRRCPRWCTTWSGW